MKKNTLFLAAVPVAMLLSGCMSADQPTPEQYQAIEKQLEKINKNISELTTRLDNYNKLAKLNANSGQNSMRSVNLALLAKIKPLGAKPTDKEIIEYVDAIKKSTIGQNSFSSNDPQVALLKKIGKGHIALLKPYLADSGFYYLRNALPELVGKEDKAFIIRNFCMYPELITLIIREGWSKEVKNDVLNMLDRGNNIWQVVNNIEMFVQDDADRKKVVEAFINNPNATELYGKISTYPNINMAEVTTKAYERVRWGDSWSKKRVARYAALNGNIDALGYLISAMSMENTGDQVPETLILLTGQSYRPETLKKWFKDNKDKLVFDKMQKRFICREADKKQ